MRYLLDTDTFTAFLYETIREPKTSPVSARIATLPSGDDVALTIVTVTEVMKGMLNLLQRMEKAGKDTQGFTDFERAYRALQHFPVVSFSPDAQVCFDAFSPAERRIGRPDCQIAAIAIVNGHTVVTRNTRHFAQIAGVVIEDWTQLENP